MGFFKNIIKGLRRTKEALSKQIDMLFTGGELDEDFYEELEYVLIGSDISASTASEIITELEIQAKKENLKTKEQIKDALRNILIEILERIESRNRGFHPCPVKEHAVVLDIELDGVRLVQQITDNCEQSLGTVRDGRVVPVICLCQPYEHVEPAKELLGQLELLKSPRGQGHPLGTSSCLAVCFFCHGSNIVMVVMASKAARFKRPSLSWIACLRNSAASLSFIIAIP